MNLNSWLDLAAQKLFSSDITSGKLDAELILVFVLKKDRTWLHAHPDHSLDPKNLKKCEQLLARRIAQEPLAYIFGSKEFYGRDFVVNENVLVPRPESETFIEIIKNYAEKNISFVDIGTGCGILAITVALEQPSWHGTATDISDLSLRVAKKNAKKYGVSLIFKNQSLIEGDDQKYDLMLANLPYVPSELRGKADISREPELALFADENGLELYRQLFEQIIDRQQKPRLVLTESLLNQHSKMAELAIQAGYGLKDTVGLVQSFVLDTN